MFSVMSVCLRRELRWSFPVYRAAPPIQSPQPRCPLLDMFKLVHLGPLDLTVQTPPSPTCSNLFIFHLTEKGPSHAWTCSDLFIIDLTVQEPSPTSTPTPCHVQTCSRIVGKAGSAVGKSKAEDRRTL